MFSLHKGTLIYIGPQLVFLSSCFSMLLLSAVTKDDEGLSILIPGSLHQEELKILNVYTPNSETHKYRKQLIKHIQNLVDKNVVIAGALN